MKPLRMAQIARTAGLFSVKLQKRFKKLDHMKATLVMLMTCFTALVNGQVSQTNLYDLIRSLLYDSTGYENVGDWGVGAPDKFPVKWEADRIEMSEDSSVHFYRAGIAQVAVTGDVHTADKWSLVIEGPRMGYTSFTLSGPATAAFKSNHSLEALLGDKPYRATLIKRCDTKPDHGFLYYELKLPAKDIEFVKLSWYPSNGNTLLRMEGYDNWSKYAVNLDCDP